MCSAAATAGTGPGLRAQQLPGPAAQEQGHHLETRGCRWGQGPGAARWEHRQGCGEGEALRGQNSHTWDRDGGRLPWALTQATGRKRVGGGDASQAQAALLSVSRPHQVSVSGPGAVPMSESPAPSGPASSQTWP